MSHQCLISDKLNLEKRVSSNCDIFLDFHKAANLSFIANFTTAKVDKMRMKNFNFFTIAIFVYFFELKSIMNENIIPTE